MKLNWFSPLPPLRTGIADYTAALLPALAERADVALWTRQESWDPSLEAFAEVRRYEQAWFSYKEFNQGDLNIYHLGNNADFHSEIWEMSRLVPGMVILHDLSLRHLFARYYQLQGNPAGFIGEMGRWHGPEAAAQAESFFNAQIPFEEVSEHFTLCGPGVEGCLGTLVHSQMAFEELRKLGSFPVLLAHLPHSARPFVARSPEAWGQGPFRLIVFGFIGPNRRLEQALEALGGLAEKDAFTLDVYGSVWDPERLLQCASAQGLAGRVRLHGFVPEAELDDALGSAHLALNLRNPTMGEASASQLRIFESSLPAIVTRTGWYGTLPEEAVAQVDPIDEVPQIRAHLASFLSDPERFRVMGERGRQLLEQRHSPAQYAQDILSFSEVCIAQGPREVAMEAALRAVRNGQAWIRGGDVASNVATLASSVEAFSGLTSARIVMGWAGGDPRS